MINWLQITAGRGPSECCWVVSQLISHIKKDAGKNKIEIKMLEIVKGEQSGTSKSVLLALEGKDSSDYAKSWDGTVQWIGKSMFRKGHKRKNWFVGVNILPQAVITKWSESEFRIEKMRSSGPGGQHANKTESAVRITHVPTGISAFAQEERSQHMNRKLAMSRICSLLEERDSAIGKKAEKDRWNQHNSLERGNPVRVFSGMKFRSGK